MFADAPPRRPAGRSGRDGSQRPRRRTIGEELDAAIRARADGRSLRALAADSGVCHETVRAALRRGAAGDRPLIPAA